MIGQHINTLLYDYMLPLFSCTSIEYDNFESNPNEYLLTEIERKQTFDYKRTAADLLIRILLIKNDHDESIYLKDFVNNLLEQFKNDKTDSFILKESIMYVLQ